MEKENNNARIYELIEQFGFEELSESEKSYVLEHISYTEYNNMRSTIVDTKYLFSGYPDSKEAGNFLTMRKILSYPVELYKVAAAIILFIGVGYLISRYHPSDQKGLMALVDTVYLEKTDTVVIRKTDTIEVIKDRIVYEDKRYNKNLITKTTGIYGNLSFQRDCIRDICPNDMDLLSKIKTKGDFSTDTSLTDFIVALN